MCTFLVAAAAGALNLPAQVRAADLQGTRRIWRRSTAQKELLIVQTTLAVLLITAAGVAGRSYSQLARQDPDARIEDLLVVSFESGPRAGGRDLEQVLTSGIDRVRTLPGVAAATVFGSLPSSVMQELAIDVPGVGTPLLDGRPPSMIESTPELLGILGLDIVQGRRFSASDDRSGAPVVIVNETMARAVWPGTSALGRCFRIGFDPAVSSRPVPPPSAPCREVVGVVRDWRQPSQRRPGERRPMHYYVPIAQDPLATAVAGGVVRVQGLLVRRASAADTLADSIRRAVLDGRSDLPFLEVRTLAQPLAPGVSHWLNGTKLLLLFSALALVTAAVGIHAAFAHAVAERRHEMAVRLAIGASRGRLVLMVLRESASVAAIGVVCGAIVAIAAGRVARSTFTEVSSASPLVIGSTAALMLTVAIVATGLPALTASRADPNALLRAE